MKVTPLKLKIAYGINAIVFLLALAVVVGVFIFYPLQTAGTLGFFGFIFAVFWAIFILDQNDYEKRRRG